MVPNILPVGTLTSFAHPFWAAGRTMIQSFVDGSRLFRGQVGAAAVNTVFTRIPASLIAGTDKYNCSLLRPNGAPIGVS
jgi:hypothetical protein